MSSNGVLISNPNFVDHTKQNEDYFNFVHLAIVQGINKYLEFIRKDKLKMKFVKVQQKNFLERYNDIAFLADLMGHESIETTRIYLRRTATEQQQIVDKIVTW